MHTPIYTKQFEKDLRLCQRRGKNLEKFKIVARSLLAGELLDPIHRDHKLTGNIRTDAEVVKVQNEELGAGKPHAGICAGGAR